MKYGKVILLWCFKLEYRQFEAPETSLDATRVSFDNLLHSPGSRRFIPLYQTLVR